MNPETIRQTLRRSDFWRDIRIYAELASSIDTLKTLADEGAAQGTVVIALEQTAARGRSGRSWSSPRGGLWLSVLLRPTFDLGQAGCVSVFTAVALAQALGQRYGLPLQVKWPNDVWVRGKKMIGILLDLSTKGQNIDWMIVSAGVNVNNALPIDARIPPTSLSQELGQALSLEEVAATVLDALVENYQTFLREGFQSFIGQWQTMSALGEVISYEKNGKQLTAGVVGLGEDGTLVVQTLWGQEFLAAEEVRLTTQGSE